MARRVQVPGRSLLRERGNSVLPVRDPCVSANPGHELDRDAGDQRRALYSPRRSVLDVLLPRLSTKVESAFGGVTGTAGRSLSCHWESVVSLVTATSEKAWGIILRK